MGHLDSNTIMPRYTRGRTMNERVLQSQSVQISEQTSEALSQQRSVFPILNSICDFASPSGATEGTLLV